MPSFAENPEPREDSLTYPLEFLHTLTGSITQLVVGLAIGLLGARLMRARHWHWSWAAVLLASILVLRPILGHLALTLGAAALSATVRGRRWHREDVRAGGDLAEIAARRSRPSACLAVLTSRLLSRLAARQGLLGAHAEERGMLIGHDEHRREVRVPFAEPAGATHTLVVGATGSNRSISAPTAYCRKKAPRNTKKLSAVLARPIRPEGKFCASSG